jgi:hypothetical protein
VRFFEPLAALGGVAVVAYTVIVLARLFVQWRLSARGHGPAAGALEERLARLESAVEGLSVETGRLTEGHRFFTQLLVKRSAQAIESGQSAPASRNGSR